MFVLEPIAGSTPGLEVWAKVPKEMTEVIPLKIDALTPAGRVLAATEIVIPPGTSTPCTGAGVMWNRELFGILKGRRLMIMIKGDFIPEAVDNGRAVDGNFLRGTLPTGDQVAGGTFWSWLTLR